jgi:hypothetical protein
MQTVLGFDLGLRPAADARIDEALTLNRRVTFGSGLTYLGTYLTAQNTNEISTNPYPRRSCICD